jgi:hypothetical protein
VRRVKHEKDAAKTIPGYGDESDHMADSRFFVWVFAFAFPLRTPQGGIVKNPLRLCGENGFFGLQQCLKYRI